MRFHQILFSIILALIFSFHAIAQGETNLTETATVTQSTTTNNGVPERAIDGDTNGNWGNGSVTHTDTEQSPWLEIDLGSSQLISHIKIYNRTDCCKDRLSDFYVLVSENPFDSQDLQTTIDQAGVLSIYYENFPDPVFDAIVNQSGQYIRIQLAGENVLSLAEVEVLQLNSGLLYQALVFEEIGLRLSTEAPFEIPVSATSGLNPFLSLVSGPADLDGTEISFTGDAGIIELTAYQSGDDYYNQATPVSTSFEVIDPATILPKVNVFTINEGNNVVMPELSQIDIYGSAAIDYEQFFSVGDVVFEIDEQKYIPQQLDNGNYVMSWTPDSYGSHYIKMSAIGSNGVVGIDSVAFEVVSNHDNNTAVAIDSAVISFVYASRNYYAIKTLPTQVGAVSKITGYLDITCPNNACDPYDRYAQIFARRPGGEWFEVLRYITPFGVACDHYVDLTEYADLLMGDVEFRVFIDTWAGGWTVDLTLDYEYGENGYTYTKMDKLWYGNIPFGNFANLQPNDTLNITFEEQTDSAQLRLITTGHGWGENNSQNAAEFRNSTHYLHIGDDSYQHHPWYTCNPNPDGCQPQSGTWEFSRAGWCPGAISHGDTYDVTSYLNDGDAVPFWFQMDPNYIDFCHPNHPNCTSGLTCTNCDDGYNPFLVTLTNLIQYSDVPYNTFVPDTVVEPIDTMTFVHQEISLQNAIQVYPNPNNGNFSLVANFDKNVSAKVSIYSINGELLLTRNIESIKSWNENFKLKDISAGLYTIKIEAENFVLNKRFTIVR